MNILVGIYSNSIGEEVNSLKASELHKMLKVKSRFSDWIKNRISKNPFIENFDYIKQEVKTNGRPFIEYYITLDMAKHLAMLENNEVGMEARSYFIEIEKQQREPKPYLIDGKDPHAIIRGCKSQLMQHIKQIELLKANIATLIKENATLALPAPAVDVEPYKKFIETQNEKINYLTQNRDHFSEMALNMTDKLLKFKNTPKRLRSYMGEFLDFPEVYRRLEIMAMGMENDIKKMGRVVG